MESQALSPRVRSVAAVGGRRVRVVFTDGRVAIVDLTPLLRGPVFSPLLADPQRFGEVRVSEIGGALEWPNGADIDPEVLYWHAASDSALAAP